MDIFVWSTIILGIWAALGPLVGVKYGQTLAKRWQKEQWFRENRKQEYREVIQALSSGLAPILHNYHQGSARTEADIRAAGTAENLVYEVLGNRIFIAEELSNSGIFDRWSNMVKAFDKDHDHTAFAKACGDMVRELRTAALKTTA